MKQLGIAYFTARGGQTAELVAAAFADEYDILRYEGGGRRTGSSSGPESMGSLNLKDWCGSLFLSGADGIIFVGACGIAVRTIAPYIKSKTTDPAVLVIDEAGQFVISLLSGHLGGANRLAEQAASILGATPVITTATDVNGKFAVDVFAKENHLRIGSMKAAKEISAAILRGEKVGVICEGRIEGKLPPELVLMQNQIQKTVPDLSPAESGSKGNARIQTGALISIGVPFFALKLTDPISEQTESAKSAFLTPPVILNLYPKSFVLGIGCRKGKPEQEITKAVQRAIDMLGITMEEIVGVASIDLKKEEPGLLEFCRKNELQFETYPAEILAAVEGDFSPSSFVKHVTGVDNVCERAALCMARKMSGQPDSEPVTNKLPARSEPKGAVGYGQPDPTEAGGRLILRKQAGDGVTVAVAEKSWSVRF
ncbi:MAG: cobalt-precorrin 5A hydrolase [Lachnospiraceae bacterium]|nr:cobalt-precorrin 5A hydrolase [Lachnospiraceae bacterium]